MNRFEQYAKELDIYSKEGMFQDSIKSLMEKRDEIDLDDYLNESLNLWIQSNEQIGKKNVAKIIVTFLSLITRAINVNEEETVNTLKTFWFGTNEDPNLEFMSSYTEYVRLKSNQDKMISNFSSQMSYSDKKNFASTIIQNYSKGVELVGKTYKTYLALAKIAAKNPVSHSNLWKLTIHQTITEFNKITDDNFSILVKGINRKIRNSEAHLTLGIDIEKAVIEIKIIKGSKVEIHTIEWSEFITEELPNIGWSIQGFVYAQILFIQAVVDKERFLENYNNIDAMI
ncbi:hypothetical protein JI528_14540 [Listeria monocytogenes]|uniref:hypothetical protein n=1 Tax=Listeria monocytogenes TaxID=1639 RepID=UPI001EDDF839|nr:hypothetical protein [Listeria monocytogenes]MCG3315200.1 hypothetical protein [Listeria monocytogenes]MCH5071782.1 hypothetical protein [Listeria monocytogenes]